MAVHNEEKCVHQAVDSILQQTLADFEFIVLDDGSTDRTGDILRSYADRRIRLLSQANAGLTISLNRCLSLAKGRYIARMDGDEISCLDRLRLQVEFLDAHQNVGLLGTCCVQITEDGAPLKLYRYPTTDAEIREALWSDCPFCHSVVMLRMECLDKVGGYRARIGPAEDYDLWFRISEHFGLANLPSPLHQTRVRPSGITLNKRFDQLRAALLVRHLTRERQRLGHDSLARLTDQELEALLNRLFPRNSANLRGVAHSTALYLAEVSYCTGDYPRAVRRLLEAVKLTPWPLRNWSLAWRLLACLLLPADATRRLKMLYRKAAHAVGGE